jgi:hypothetical protein
MRGSFCLTALAGVRIRRGRKGIVMITNIGVLTRVQIPPSFLSWRYWALVCTLNRDELTSTCDISHDSEPLLLA